MKIKLKDAFDLQMGKTPTRSDTSCWNGIHKWVSIADIGNAGKYITTTKEKISDKGVQTSGIKIVPKGTVIMSFKLSIGKTAITSEDMYTNEAIMAFHDNGKYEIDVGYLYHFCCGTDWGQGTNKAVMGLTLNKATLLEHEMELPDISKQRIVAQKLDKMDDIISERKIQLKMLDELVKSRFIELFGDPVSNPKRWDKEELSQCLTSIDNGKSFVCDSNPRTGTEPAVLKLSAATYGYYKPEENKAMIEVEQFVENAEVHSGDLLFTRKNTPELVGMCAYVYDTPDKLMMPDLIFRLNVSERCDKIFLWKLINHDLFRPCIENIATGSAKSMSNISKERLQRLKIILPPLELQQQFATFVAEVDKSKRSVQKSLQELETLKKSLMQQYFG